MCDVCSRCFTHVVGIVITLILVGTLLDIIAFSTPAWASTTYTQTGLWETCSFVGGQCNSTVNSDTPGEYAFCICLHVILTEQS